MVAPLFAKIIGSKHDLRSAGSSNDACIYCHVPHIGKAVQAPWNSGSADRVYTLYSSPTLQAQPGQPDGSSRICLSCHDGTIAPAQAPGASSWNRTMATGPGNLTTDLSDDHPISLSLIPRVDLAPPGPTARARLDPAGKVQCTSCHDPHDTAFEFFLLQTNRSSRLCLECHRPGNWQASAHSNSTATYIRKNPWFTQFTTVAENGCENCHRPHAAAGRVPLLTGIDVNETCLACHDGNFGENNIRLSLNRSFSHRAIACDECHEPHSIQPDISRAPTLPRSMGRVSGATEEGIPKKTADFEYEVCFKCHGRQRPVSAYIPRRISPVDITRSFLPLNPSIHPVMATGRNPDVPSLYNGWTTASVMYCSDCHADESGIGTTGTHGSSYRPLLRAQYDTADMTMESPAAYALCYTCHDRAIVLYNSSFPLHKMHVQDENTPCSACHDAHGVAAQMGATPLHNSHLINFDTRIVQSAANGVAEFTDLGDHRGACTLRCHQQDHQTAEYGPGGVKW
jgi:predicted CXXCH cytochrome family protein